MPLTRRRLLASTAAVAGASLLGSRPSRAAITPGKPFAGQEISVLAVQSTQFAAHAKKVAAFTEQTGIKVNYVYVPFVALRERLGAAELDEHRATVDAIFTKGQAALTTGVDLYGEYGRLAVSLRDVVEKLAALDSEITSCNAQLRDAGDERSIADLDTQARPTVDPAIGRPGGPWRYLRLPSSIHPTQ